MEKFEKILSLFVRNPYDNIELSNEYEKRKSKFIFALFLLSLMTIFSIGFSIFNISFSLKNSTQFYLILYTQVYFIFIILVINLYFILNLYKFIYKQTNYLFSSIYLLNSFFVSILLCPLSLLFLIDNIQSLTVYSYYVTFLFLIVFYSYYYHNKWKKFILDNHLKKIKKRLINNKYSIDSDERFFKFDLEEDEKDKPKLTKIAGSVVSFMMRFGFTLPILAVLASSGTGGNSMIYFAIYLMFLIIPEIMKIVTKQSALYSILKQIEKEENVTIYNGKLIINDEKIK